MIYGFVSTRWYTNHEISVSSYTNINWIRGEEHGFYCIIHLKYSGIAHKLSGISGAFSRKSNTLDTLAGLRNFVFYQTRIDLKIPNYEPPKLKSLILNPWKAKILNFEPPKTKTSNSDSLNVPNSRYNWWVWLVGGLGRWCVAWWDWVVSGVVGWSSYNRDIFSS